MKQSIQISRFGGPEVLKIVDLKSDALMDESSVRIRVKAAGVNFADVMMRMGLYPEAPKPPFVPGYEIAGEIVECGKSVHGLSVGDKVLAGTRFGGYTTEIVLPAFQIKKIPEHLSEEEAASIPVNFLTAWIALCEMARIKKGDAVLIQSAAGGVGLAACQICNHFGAKAVGLVSSRSKELLLKTNGVKEIYTYDEWKTECKKETQRFQVILNSHGGNSLKADFKNLSSLGRIVSFGASTIVSGPKRSLSSILSFSLNTAIFTPFKLMMENKGVFGLNLLSLFEDLETKKSDVLLHSLDSILERFKDRSFLPNVGNSFPMIEAGNAHQALLNRANTGKTVLTIP